MHINRPTAPEALKTSSGFCRAISNISQAQWPDANKSGITNDDVYRQLRHRALKLSHKWQKALRKAAAARAAGDHAAAHQLTAEAQTLKEQADAAHAEAALKIEVSTNVNSGLWELDLHGLHSKEALQALQQRLDLLQELLLDVMSLRSTGHASTASSVNLELSKIGSGQQLLESSHVSRLPALRVIVGKGNHSSGGEATLPRAVEHYLIDAQYKYLLRGGAIEVKLKRLIANQS
eukprot:gene4766-5016_t